MQTEPIDVTLQVTRVLDRLQIPYFIGGSMATAIHGVIRATMDVDIVADIHIDQAELFTSALKDAFYVDLEMVTEAILRRGSFNLLHLDSMFKVDIFIIRQRPFDLNQMQRRVNQQFGNAPDESLFVSTVEDIILAKLEWFRSGGEVSERQWRDIIGVLQIQKDTINYRDLQKWAENLDVADLLERAYREAGIPPN